MTNWMKEYATTVLSVIGAGVILAVACELYGKGSLFWKLLFAYLDGAV